MNIGEYIWDAKYRLRNEQGEPLDETIDDTHRRVADALTKAEQPNLADQYGEQFYQVLRNFEFLPAGRIVAGAGSGRTVTLFNCYVMGTIPDSLDGIFTMLREAALTMQQGGGIGYDFSTLRPKGAPVRHLGSDASGPLSFMDCWDAMCKTIMSAGSRRGAMMGTMRCDHPDIEEFVDAKRDSARFRNFNLSVLVTDLFMTAVREDREWTLYHQCRPLGVPAMATDGRYVYRTIRARDLWDRIMRATYDVAEPGVIFIDRIQSENNLWYCEKIAATNPCGEQPLPPYGACLLGSVNLARLIRDPFSDQAVLDLDRLVEVVRIAVRMLDNTIDVSGFPLEAQLVEAHNKRRVGLGVTGVADALLMLGVEYGTDEAVKWLDLIMREIMHAAYSASIALAAEKRAFHLLQSQKFSESGFQRRHPTLLSDPAFRVHGIRNSHLLSVAPTGTISLYAGNVSSGIEPIFAPEYQRTFLRRDGVQVEETVVDYAVGLWRQMGHDGLPPAYVDVQTLSPEAHLNMQAVAQRYVDSSISKTINLPEDISFEDFRAVYTMAYERGCKGCTTYRPNKVTGSILRVAAKEVRVLHTDVDESGRVTETEHSAWIQGLSDMSPETLLGALSSPPPRPESLDSRTMKIKVGDRPALYVTVSFKDGAPYEVFFNTKSPESFAYRMALSRMISAVFRRGGDVSFVAQELKEIFDPKGGGYWRKRYWPSEIAAIGQVIEDCAYEKALVSDVPVMTSSQRSSSGVDCRVCLALGSVVMQEGCAVCKNCGHSECG